jgi:hypothetical protein
MRCFVFNTAGILNHVSSKTTNKPTAFSRTDKSILLRGSGFSSYQEIGLLIAFA